MEWLSDFPTLLGTAAIVVVPGLLVAWGLRLRGLAVYALAPLFTTSIAAVGPVVLQMLGLPWDSRAFAALTVVSAAVAAALGRLAPRPSRSTGAASRLAWPAWTTVAGLGLGAAVAGSQFMRIFGEPERISQTADNIFHLNAIRYIVETGSASSFNLGTMTGIPFYPAAWPTLGALVVQVTGASVPVAVSSLTIVTAAILWPASILFLARQICPESWRVGLFSGIVAASFPAQPILLAMWGVLYPNLFSVALLPAALALAVRALGLAKDGRTLGGRPLVCLVLGAPGLALAHPGAAMALVAMTWPLAVLSARRIAARLDGRGMPSVQAKGVVGTVLVLAAAATVFLWARLRPEAEASIGPPVQSLAQAMGQIFLAAPMGSSMALMVAVGFLAGLVAIWRSGRSRWPLGVFGVTAFLFITVSSFDRVPLREYITGVWYNDAFRIGALLPVAMAPIVLVGFDTIVVWLSRQAGRLREVQRPGRLASALAYADRSPLRVNSVVAVMLLSLVMVEGQMGSMRKAVWDAQPGYLSTDQSELLTTDEEKLLSRVAQHVPDGVAIAGNPWTGASLVYAYAGRRTPELHTLSTVNQDILAVDGRLRDARTDPAVCDAVRRLGIGYALDFGTREFRNLKHDAYRGLEGLEESGVAHVVDQEGDARLLKLDVCGVPGGDPRTDEDRNGR